MKIKFKISVTGLVTAAYHDTTDRTAAWPSTAGSPTQAPGGLTAASESTDNPNHPGMLRVQSTKYGEYRRQPQSSRLVSQWVELEY